MRSFGDGALEDVDQLGDGGKDRAVVGCECGVAILQPAFDRFVSIGGIYIWSGEPGFKDVSSETMPWMDGSTVCKASS